ncbi:unnamed protein product, partial [Laminaria digitata]
PPSPNPNPSLLKLRFASLPAETRTKYEHPASSFALGWSHGRETLEAGRPDVAKGSFYANPCFDDPFPGDGREGGAAESHPALAHPNVWPDLEVPELSMAFKGLGKAVVRVGVMVARQCDRWVLERGGGGGGGG